MRQISVSAINDVKPRLNEHGGRQETLSPELVTTLLMTNEIGTERREGRPSQHWDPILQAN